MIMTRELVVIAHNIRSLWNVGSIFRSADAFGVTHIYLTGYTGCPPRMEIGKTALGAEEWIAWSYEKDPLTVIERLKKKKFQVIALEKTKNSEPLQTFHTDASVALILGHEVQGVSDELIAASDTVLHIPMRGKKESLNVSTAAGIAMYELSR